MKAVCVRITHEPLPSHARRVLARRSEAPRLHRPRMDRALLGRRSLVASQVRGAAMTVEVLRVIHRGAKYLAPLLEVQCSVCLVKYRTQSWISDVKQRKSCHACASLIVVDSKAAEKRTRKGWRTRRANARKASR